MKASGVPWEEATASVLIQKAVLVLSLVLYVFLGLALTPFLLNVTTPHLSVLSLATLILAVASLAFLFVQKQNPCTLGVRVLEKCRLCPQSLKNKEEELASLDACLAGFYREHPGRGFLRLPCFF